MNDEIKGLSNKLGLIVAYFLPASHLRMLTVKLKGAKQEALQLGLNLCLCGGG